MWKAPKRKCIDDSRTVNLSRCQKRRRIFSRKGMPNSLRVALRGLCHRAFRKEMHLNIRKGLSGKPVEDPCAFFLPPGDEKVRQGRSSSPGRADSASNRQGKGCRTPLPSTRFVQPWQGHGEDPPRRRARSIPPLWLFRRARRRFHSGTCRERRYKSDDPPRTQEFQGTLRILVPHGGKEDRLRLRFPQTSGGGRQVRGHREIMCSIKENRRRSGQQFSSSRPICRLETGLNGGKRDSGTRCARRAAPAAASALLLT